MMGLALLVARYRHSKSGRKRGRSVARPKHVIFGFVSTQEAADAAILFDSRQEVAPACQNFVCICLVPHIPNKTVVRGLKRVVQRHSQLNCSKRSSGVAANARHGFEYILPNLVGYLLQP